jgi:hypothetical protein
MNFNFGNRSLITLVQENATQLLKILADKPTIGLYYIQQHVHRAVPNMITLKVVFTSPHLKSLLFICLVYIVLIHYLIDY